MPENARDTTDQSARIRRMVCPVCGRDLSTLVDRPHHIQQGAPDYRWCEGWSVVKWRDYEAVDGE